MLVPLVRQALLAPQAPREMLAWLAQRDHRELKVYKDPLARLALRAILVNRVLKVRRDLRGHKAQLDHRVHKVYKAQ